jgi:hypothetical protein
MVQLTDVDGTAYATAADVPADTTTYGPYLQKAPVNPFTQSSTTGAAAAGVGWVYTQATGVITAVMPLAKAEELDMDGSNDISTYGAD